jgi:outer membrane beta-barrel protein
MTILPVGRPTRTSRTTSGAPSGASKLASLALGLLAPFFGALVAVPHVVAPAMAADAPAKQALDEFNGRKIDKNTVQNKFFLKTNRFEIAPSLGYVPNNAFVSNYYGGAFLAYHFSETFAAEGAFFYAPNSGQAGVKNLTKTLVAIAYDSNPDTTFQQPLDRLQLGAIFSARWAPVYGKINLIGEGVLNFDLYGTAGAGLLLVTKDYAAVSQAYKDSSGGFDADGNPVDPVDLQDAPETVANPAINLGIGLDFFVTQSIAIKLDARSELYFAAEPDYGNEGEQLQNQLYNTFMTTAGVSIFVPKMKPRMFNF